MFLSRVINCKSTNYYLSSTIFLVFLYLQDFLHQLRRGHSAVCQSSASARAYSAPRRDDVGIHHPRLRYAHLGLINFDLFEVVNGGVVSPQQHGCQGPQTQSPASCHNATCVGNADMRCGRGVNVQLQTAACESASASSSLSPPL